MEHLRKPFSFMLAFFLLMGCVFGISPQKTMTVTAAAKKVTVKYKYKGKSKQFKGTPRTVYYDTKKIGLAKTPVLVMSGYHMAPYYEIFVKASVKAKKSYHSKTKKLTLTSGTHTIKMTVESKTAYVDGKKVKLPIAPKIVTYSSSKLSRVLVPMKETAKFLGLTYYWDKKSSTIKLSKPEGKKDTFTTEHNTNTESTKDTENTTILDHTATTALDNTKDSENTTAADSTGGANDLSPSTSTQDSSLIETPGEDDGEESGDFAYTMSLLRPEDVEEGTIACVDDYNNKRLKITMDGDQRDFYEDNRPNLASGVKFSSDYSVSSGQTTLYFKTTSINGFRVKEDADYIYIKHGKPTEIFKNVIVIDAGHGGSDSGAVGNGYKEKNMTLSIVKAAKKCFDKNSDYKVYYTRLKDTYPSLSDRYKLANAVKADMFISVHINSAGKTATGTETLYNPDRNKKSSAGLNCKNLASYTQKYVKAATGFTDRGLKKRCSRLKNGLAVLNNNNGPATLTEIGFISNPSEAKKMNKNLSIYGKAVYDAAVYATSKYPTGR